MSSREKVFKAGLIDLSTGELRNFLYNPENWTDERFVTYAATTIPGISFPRYQFVSGGDTIIQFKLFFSAFAYKNGADDLLADIFWIRSLTYPRKSSNIAKVAPPRVLFVWPGVYSSQCVISTANIQYDSFFPDGKVKYCYLDIELKKSIDEAIYS